MATQTIQDATAPVTLEELKDYFEHLAVAEIDDPDTEADVAGAQLPSDDEEFGELS